MFLDLIEYPVESRRLGWEARQVVRDLYGEPHLLLRVTLTGTHFPHRALEPVVTIGNVRSRFVEIADDGLSANAYFDEPPPDGADVDFAYGGGPPILRLPRAFDAEGVRILDRERLPKNTRQVERFFTPVIPVG